MTSNDIVQIQIAGNRTGIIGLKAVLEKAAEEFEGLPDTKIKDELVRRLSKQNYIPEKMKTAYAEAFLREFNLFIGKPVEKESSQKNDTLSIKLLGPGCANCDRMAKGIFNVLSELNLSADFEHVKDVREISRYGIMGMPALIINGALVASGSAPSNAKIKQLIENAMSKQKQKK